MIKKEKAGPEISIKMDILTRQFIGQCIRLGEEYLNLNITFTMIVHAVREFLQMMSDVVEEPERSDAIERQIEAIKEVLSKFEQKKNIH